MGVGEKRDVGAIYNVPVISLPQTTLSSFKKTDFSSVREHEEFVWLHDRFVESEEYAGIIVRGGHCVLLTTICVCSVSLTCMDLV